MFCKGLHCAGCISKKAWPAFLIVVILCLIEGPRIAAILRSLLVPLIITVLLGAAIGAGALTIVMVSKNRQTLEVRGTGFLTLPGVFYDESNHQTVIASRVDYPALPVHNIKAISARPAYERKETR